MSMDFLQIRSLLLMFTISLTVGCSDPLVNSSVTPWIKSNHPSITAISMGADNSQNPTSIPLVTQTNSPTITAIQTNNPENNSNPLIENTTPYKDQLVDTPTPISFFPEAKIQIVSPGTLSKVTSPISLISYVQPGNDRKVYIELIGEDGKLLFQDFRVYQDLPRLWAPVTISLPYTIHSVLDYARLQVYTIDQFQRVISLNSVNIFLQQDGLNRIHSNKLLHESFVITSPFQMEDIYGGMVRIEGIFHPLNSQPIQIDLISSSGSILGSKTIDSLPNLSTTPIFLSTEIEYKVDNPTPVRLTLCQLDVHTSGCVYIFSQEIVLNPP